MSTHLLHTETGATYQIIDVEPAASTDGFIRGVAEGVHTGALVSFHQIAAPANGSITVQVIGDADHALDGLTAGGGILGSVPAAVLAEAVLAAA